MLQNMIEGAKDAIRAGARMSIVVAATALTALTTLCFLCAAAFAAVYQTYGLIAACLAGAGLFLVVTILLLIWLNALKRRAAQKAAERKETAKSAVQTALADPMVVAAGLQLVSKIGLKRLIPLIAVGGIALGLMAKPPSRPRADDQRDAAGAAEGSRAREFRARPGSRE